MAKEQSIRVSTNEKPTMWNRSATLGFALFGGPTGMPVSLITGLIGGLWQRSNMKADLDVGKRLDPPTFWNSSIITGMLLTTQITAIAAMVLGGVTIASGAVAATPLATAAMLAAPLIGALYGGFSRKNQMAKEYAAGKEQLAYESLKTGRAFGVEPEIALSTEKGRGQSQQVSNPYYNSVTPAETKLMDARMKAGPDMEKLDYRQQMELAKLEQEVEAEQGNTAAGGR